MSQTKTWTLFRDTVTKVLDTGGSGQGSGLNDHLLVGRSGSSGTRRNYKSYIKFTPDWTDVRTLVSAVLTLYTDDLSEFGTYDSNDVPKVTVRKLTSAFVEGNSAGFDSGDYTAPKFTTADQKTATMNRAASSLVNIDVTKIVKAWAPSTVAGGAGTLAQANARNFGFGLFGSSSADENWGGWSKEHGVPGERPSLTLTYELGATTPNTPSSLSPAGTVASVGAFEGDFSDVRATDTLVQTQVQVYVNTAVKSGDADLDDTIDVTAHGYKVGQEVWFHSLTGGVGLLTSQAYYVRSIVNANSFKVAATVGGPVVNVTTAYSALTVASPKWSKTKSASETETLNDRSFVLPEGLDLLRNTQYKWRMRQKDNDARWSAWAALVAITVTNDDPDAPTAVTPNKDGVPAAVDFATLYGVVFRATFGDSDPADYMLAYQYQLSEELPDDPNWDDASFLLWDTGKQYVGLDTDVSESGYGGQDLAAGTYYWRARHWDQHDGLSDWSYARIVLTADFNADPGSQSEHQESPHSPWRVRIREFAFNTLNTGAITGVAATNLMTTVKNHGLAVGRKVRFSALTGGTGLLVGVDYYVISSGLAAKTFKVSTVKGGTEVNFTTALTAAVLTGVTTRGPGNVVAIIENAKSVGGSIVYNSPGEAHFTLPIDHPQLAVIEPKQVHYGIDFYTGDGWRETYAGLVWDLDASETDAVFPCIDYLGLLDAVSDERYVPSDPDRSYTKGGSKYSDVTLRNVIIDQLTRATTLANSPVGFISIGSIATMSEKVTVWSTMQPVLGFISGLIDSHRQGLKGSGAAVKKTRIQVKRTTVGGYEFVIEDDPGQVRDNLRLRYGELVNGYRVVVFGDNWSSVLHTVGRTREGVRVLYETANAPGIDQGIWGRFARAIILDNVSDQNDAARRTKQAAIKFGKFGQGLAIAVRSGILRPREGYDVTDDFPVAIQHGAVNTDNYGSGYFTCWAIAWEAQDNGSESVTLTLSPREDTEAPDDDLVDSHNISTQPEWQLGWAPPNPVKASSLYWLDQNTGKVYVRDDGILVPLEDITGTV